MNYEIKQKALRRCGWLGIAAVVFYFLHVVIGGMLHPGYDRVGQAISDLTANGAPSELAARILSGFYGVFELGFRIAFYLFLRKKINRIFTAGAFVFIIMTAVSAIGFTVFPLSAAGGVSGFQNAMHIVTTVAVVALSIAALILLAVGFIRHKRYKIMGILAIVTLCLMAAGSVLAGALPAILGLAERVNIYALHLYTVSLSVFMLKGKEM